MNPGLDFGFSRSADVATGYCVSNFSVGLTEKVLRVPVLIEVLKIAK